MSVLLRRRRRSGAALPGASKGVQPNPVLRAHLGSFHSRCSAGELCTLKVTARQQPVHDSDFSFINMRVATPIL